MQLIKIMRIGLAVICSGWIFVSCAPGFGEDNAERYDYEVAEKKFQRGQVHATFNPEPREIRRNQGTVIVWSNPYRFSTQYIVDEKSKITKGKIWNIKVASTKTGKILFSSSEIVFDSNTIRRVKIGKKIKDSNRFATLGFGVDMPNMEWKNYMVSFDFEVFDEDGALYEAGHFKNMIKTNYNPEIPRL